MAIKTIQWSKGVVKIIDQTLLPTQFKFIHCRDVKTLWQAIKRLSVRGAPAIGVAGALGILLGMKTFKGNDTLKFIKHLDQVAEYLGSSRPTAVNLFNMIERMIFVAYAHRDKTVSELKILLEKEALVIYEEDRRDCRTMGRFGATLIPSNSAIMTICNAGALATVDYGTALGVMYSAQEQGKKFTVYACETRPLLQGARLTAWELTRSGIDTTLICDNMAATVMRQKKIKAIFAGADRVASNGDAANKVGTYSLAVLAKYHKIPFYIVAPRSTFDMNIRDGRQIPIEERGREEVAGFRDVVTAPKEVKVFNPAFDVTDAKLITAIVTEKGIVYPPFRINIKKIFQTIRV